MTSSMRLLAVSGFFDPSLRLLLALSLGDTNESAVSPVNGLKVLLVSLVYGLSYESSVSLVYGLS